MYKFKLGDEVKIIADIDYRYVGRTGVITYISKISGAFYPYEIALSTPAPSTTKHRNCGEHEIVLVEGKEEKEREEYKAYYGVIKNWLES